VTKSRKIRWARHVARLEERRDAYNLREGDYLEKEPYVGGY
jgi:hypothetical protein